MAICEGGTTVRLRKLGENQYPPWDSSPQGLNNPRAKRATMTPGSSLGGGAYLGTFPNLDTQVRGPPSHLTAEIPAWLKTFVVNPVKGSWCTSRAYSVSPTRTVTTGRRPLPVLLPGDLNPLNQRWEGRTVGPNSHKTLRVFAMDLNLGPGYVSPPRFSHYSGGFKFSLGSKNLNLIVSGGCGLKPKSSSPEEVAWGFCVQHH